MGQKVKVIYKFFRITKFMPFILSFGGSYYAEISCLYRIQNVNKLDKNSITIFFLYIVQSDDRLYKF